MDLGELYQLVDAWSIATPTENGYGYHDSQSRWRYDPSIEQDRYALHQLLRVLCAANLGNTYLHIGLGRHGGSHFALSQIARRVISIEIDQQRIDRFLAHNPSLAAKDQFIAGDSANPKVQQQAAEICSALDLLFIDGADKFAALQADWVHYAHLVRPGGIVAIADASQAYACNRQGDGVDRLIADLEADFLQPHGIRLRRFGNDRAIHYYVQTEASTGDSVLPQRLHRSSAPMAEHLHCDHHGFALFAQAGGYYAVPERQLRGPHSFDHRRIPTGDYDIVLRADTESELSQLISDYTLATPLLQQLQQAVRDKQLDAALQTAQQLHRQAPDLRSRLVASLETYPHSAELLLNQGTLALFDDRRQEGLHLLLQALDQDLGNADLLGLLANTYMLLLDDQDGARTLLSEVRRRVRNLRIEELCRELPPGYPLWSYPRFLKDVRGVIQVGAHSGAQLPPLVSLQIPHQAYIEPNPAVVAQLAQRARNHAAADTEIKVLALACDQQGGQRQLRFGADTQLAALGDTDPTYDQLYPDDPQHLQIEVPTETLDHLLSQGKLLAEHYNLLLVDAPGNENEILAGAEQCLRHFDTVCVTHLRPPIYAGLILPAPTIDLLRRCGLILLVSQTFADQRIGMTIFGRPRRQGR